ncbi:MAG: lytic transglycosylase domain-containing protein, partial [Rariglobus sp.]
TPEPPTPPAPTQPPPTTPIPTPVPGIPGPKPEPEPQPSGPAVTPEIPTAADIPMYDLWVSRLRDRPRPQRANEFLPDIKKIFAAEGVPAELAWLAETESSFNPRARSPVGARGLFQFMPITAKAQGLSLWPIDERTDPQKSARAAAALLRRLHGLFDSWPLALAAYNAGEGRVRRTLKAQDAKTFAGIADALPTETRLYVPKVLATLAVREGIAPASLAAPTVR